MLDLCKQAVDASKRVFELLDRMPRQPACPLRATQVMQHDTEKTEG